MASDDTMTFKSHSSLQDEDFDNDIDDHHIHHHPHPNNLSRLSVCTSSTTCDVDVDVDDDLDDDDVDHAMAKHVSALSMEGDDGDADGEFSDGKEVPAGLSSDSENELGSCYSMLATPPRLRRNIVKDYASDKYNDAQKGVFIMGQKTKENHPLRRRRRRRMRKDISTWACESSEYNSGKNKKKKEEDSGESDQSGSTGTGRGLRVITRPKGGRRSLYMDMEEVKACRDLGFELELEMPSRFSFSSNSTLDTSSAATSRIANWRVSSAGDGSRDVKARLKMWAQAVAASVSKFGTSLDF